MVRIKKIVFVLIFVMLLTALFGAYLKDQPQTLTQPDGNILKCLASGDEFYNWLHDENGYTIIQDPDTGFYVYANLSGEKLIATNYIVGQIDPFTTDLQAGINVKPAGYERRIEEFNQLLKENRNRVSTTGDLNNLVVFIRFADQVEFTEPITLYDGMFNAEDVNSMYQYFYEVSDQQLNATSSFYPEPNGNLIVSYQSPNPRNYYEVYNSVTNPNGYQQGQQATREHALLQSAIQYVETQIPESLDLDNDDDGYVDNVCFIVKGGTGAWADLLWPHMWALYTYNVYIHGVQVWTYNFQLSQSLSGSGVGVLCHEMFHSLGAPDLYHYTSNGISPAGSWDLMCSNTNPPQHMTTWMKHRYGQWFDDVPEINTSGTYTLAPVVDSPYSCYKIPSPNSSTEFFMVEYRKKTGIFEPSVPNDGLIIYRIDLNEDGNAQGPPDELYIFRPDGTMTNNGNINEANFSADAGRTMFNDSTNPAAFLQYGAPGGIFISDIGFAGDTIEFTLNTGLIPMFETNVQTGPAYLGIQFTNTSYPTNEIDGFEWDFDGDGTYDSTEENPFHFYTDPGEYDVTLRIEVNGEFAEITAEDYINVTNSSSVTGNVSGAWVSDFSPYIISGDINIAEDDELTINPGVELQFAEDVLFTVNGLLIADASSSRSEPIVFNSDSSWSGIKFNNTQESNILSNCEISNANNSAISIEVDSNVDIIGCKIFENNSTSQGAAFKIVGSDDVLISQNIIANNSSATNSGGFVCTASSPEISNNIIVNNTGLWGGFYFQNNSNPVMINNTIANNQSLNSTPYLFFLLNSVPIILNSVIIDSGNLHFPLDIPEITYSCVTGGFEGTGNIDEDPIFVAATTGDGTNYNGLTANWNLMSNSPCIDAGHPNTIYNDLDGSQNDMGAYGGPNSYALAPTESDNNTINITNANSISVYPNPFNPTTNISLSINESDIQSPITVEIFNIKGQLVKTILKNQIVSDTNFIWHGKNNNGDSTASGMYFIKLKTVETDISKKMLLLK